MRAKRTTQTKIHKTTLTQTILKKIQTIPKEIKTIIKEIKTIHRLTILKVITLVKAKSHKPNAKTNAKSLTNIHVQSAIIFARAGVSVGRPLRLL